MSFQQIADIIQGLANDERELSERLAAIQSRLEPHEQTVRQLRNEQAIVDEELSEVRRRQKLCVARFAAGGGSDAHNETETGSVGIEAPQVPSQQTAFPSQQTTSQPRQGVSPALHVPQPKDDPEGHERNDPSNTGQKRKRSHNKSKDEADVERRQGKRTQQVPSVAAPGKGQSGGLVGESGTPISGSIGQAHTGDDPAKFEVPAQYAGSDNGPVHPRFPTVVSIDGRYVEIVCRICGCNKAGKGAMLKGMVGLKQHHGQAHGPIVHDRPFHKERVVSGIDVLRLKKGKDPTEEKIVPRMLKNLRQE